MINEEKLIQIVTAHRILIKQLQDNLAKLTKEVNRLTQLQHNDGK